MQSSSDACQRCRRNQRYQCDIKKRTVQLTAEGIRKAEQHFGLENLGDPANMEINHHIVQALRANALFVRDKDYVVQDGEVLIVDEFTSRLMIGRRYKRGPASGAGSQGGVKVEENQTLATITLQNYFRINKTRRHDGYRQDRRGASS